MEKRYVSLILGMSLIILLFTQPGLTQPSDELRSLKKEIENLKEGQKAIQKDLQEIKNLLRAAGLLIEEPQNVFLNIAGKPIKGNKNARVTLMEFSEYQ
jgi:peptidoglycan hydrolase CwlO-like protein